MSDFESRSYDGSDNNSTNPDWGRAGTNLLRLTSPSYYGGKCELSGRNRPNPRTVSNTICRRDVGSTATHHELSDFIWAWGQFLDHELDLTEGSGESADIEIPCGDPEPGFENGGIIPFERSEYDQRTGTAVNNPRQQINRLSSYIDGANVYGASATRAGMLRAFDGTGKLKVCYHAAPNGRELLPKNVAGFPNANPGRRPDAELSIAGDIRANEHVVLISMHTLFLREHNRICEDIVAREPGLDGNDEAIFQRARKTVGALMQVITFEEFLPALLGADAFAPYGAYNEHVDASISNVFSTASYRFGHSMLSPTIKVPGVHDDRARIIDGEMRLRDAFFKPEIVEQHGIEPFLLGLTQQRMREIDVEIEEEVRSFLFHDIGSRDDTVMPPMLLDLAALNIQRGRDHGLADYNQCRADFGLPRKQSFAEITSDAALQSRLSDVYGDVNLIDPWVGGLAEGKRENANVGEFLFVVLQDQFRRLRDGDRFWYENDSYFSQDQRDELKRTKLADVIRRNTDIADIPAGADVFRSHDCGSRASNAKGKRAVEGRKKRRAATA